MSRRLLFLYTLVGRGGDAIQAQSMLEAFGRIGVQATAVGASPIQPYQFGGKLHGIRILVRSVPWWLRDALELFLNLLVSIRGVLVGRRIRPDVVLERMTPYSLAGVMVARHLNVPLILQLDAPFGLERSRCGQSLFRGLHQAVVRFASNRASLVIVGSETSRRYYLSLGVAPAKMLVFPNGVFSGDLVKSARPENGTPVIGFIGSMATWHRVDLLLEAFARLRASGVDARLRLVGRGVTFDKVRQQIGRLDLGGAVELCGPLSRREAIAELDHFQVAVLPDTLDTGSPIKLFEYAARRIPMVVPDLPNLRQIWGDDTAAYFSPGNVEDLANSLARLLWDSEERLRLSTAAWCRVDENYRLEKQWLQVIDRASPIVRPQTRAAAVAGI